MTTISITQTGSDDRPEHQHRKYDVMIDNFTIQTIVTRSNTVASAWLRETNALTYNNRRNIVVGFDVKNSPGIYMDGYDQNSAAVVLLCFHNRCLIYQLFQQIVTIDDDDFSDLESFFANGSGYEIIGENIKINASSVLSSENLTNIMELSAMAVAVLDDDSLRGQSARELAATILNMEIEPESVDNIDWDREILSMEQVKDAVVDVYLSYKIGMVLEAYDYEPIDSCGDTASSDD